MARNPIRSEAHSMILAYGAIKALHRASRMALQAKKDGREDQQAHWAAVEAEIRDLADIPSEPYGC